jgi:hypothetical protein
MGCPRRTPWKCCKHLYAFVSYRRLSAHFQFPLFAVTLVYLSRRYFLLYSQLQGLSLTRFLLHVISRWLCQSKYCICSVKFISLMENKLLTKDSYATFPLTACTSEDGYDRNCEGTTAPAVPSTPVIYYDKI